MKNLLRASIFFALGFILTSCGVESVSSLLTPPTLSVGAGTGSEGGNITFTVSLSSTAVSAVTFKYRTELGTGYTAEQADFTAIAETDGIISIGETTTTIEVITNYDNEDDGNESFGLVLSNVSGAVFASAGSGAGTTLTAKGIIINNNDVLVPLPTLSVGAGTGGEATGEVVFTVSLSSTAVGDVTFKYRTEVGTGDTAQPADFTAIAETDGIITAGDTTFDIIVAITDDIDDDDDETFSLVLSYVSGAVFASAGGGAGTTLTAIGTITDNDGAVTPPTLSVGAGTGGEATGEVVFTVSLSKISAEATTFKYRTEIGTGDTAQQADFTAIAETDGIITAGDTTFDIIVAITDDIDDDDDETFGLVLSAVSGAVFASAGGGAGTTLTAIGTITDNDLPPPMLSVGAARGDEGGIVTFTVSLNRTVLSDVTFKYRTDIGTDNTADQADFTAIGAVGAEMDGTIDANNTTLDVAVAITSDTIAEGDNTFSLVLSAVSGAVFAGGGTTLIATGTITDDDVADSNGNGLLDIANATELANIRYNLAGTSYKTSSTDAGDSSYCPTGGCNGYELIDNIDLVSFTNWTPIQGQADTTITTSDACVDDNSGVWDGTECLLPTALFSAIFDGNVKTISNLTISKNAYFLGLFGVVSGTLKNLNLREGSITASNVAGALAGYLVSGGIIEASSSNLAVTGGDVKNFELGGLAGISYGTIQDSYATGVVTAGDGDYGKVGGLVGGNYSGTIQDSYATGVVTGGDGTYNYLGGLVGWNSGTIQDSYAMGAVTAGVSVRDYLGGLVGYNGESDTIQGSYAIGAVTGSAGNDYMGGLVGLNDGDVYDSYATGTVAGGLGNDYVGGLVGLSDARIRNSYATGAVTGAVIDAMTGAIIGAGAGQDYVGGLVGWTYESSVTQNSYALGAVTGGDGSTNELGGLVGSNNGGYILFSYATGAVTGGAGEDVVGGLVGWTYESSSHVFSTILNSYALGAVIGGAGDDDYVGRIVGSVGGANIFGNYYIDANTLEGENKRVILTDEAVEKTVGKLRVLTAATTQTDFTSADTTDGWNIYNWDFALGKYPSLKSYKVDANTDLQIDGELLCGQGADWVQCSP